MGEKSMKHLRLGVPQFAKGIQLSKHIDAYFIM